MSTTTEIKKLGRFEIQKELGKGAMGVVYKGYDKMLDRYAAIKTIRGDLDQDDEEATQGRARFEREAQAAARINHAGIVSVYEYGESDGITFIAMEFVEGRTLKDIFESDERFGVDRLVDVMVKILEALDYAHAKGIVHRDIKPANIMITPEGQPKIMDFGVARIEASTMTQVGTVLGTPSYMSPEQFMGQIVDKRADIFSCGAMFYQLLTGDKPFTGSITAIMQKVLNEMPTPPSRLNPHLPMTFDAVVSKAMAKRPGDRYQNAKEFAEAISKAHRGIDVDRPAAPADDEATVASGPPPRPIAAAAPAVRAAADDEATMAEPARTGPPPMPSDDDEQDISAFGALSRPPAPAASPRPDPVAPRARPVPPPPPPQSSGGGGSVAMIAGGGVVAVAAVGAALWFLVLNPAAVPEDPPGKQVAASTGSDTKAGTGDPVGQPTVQPPVGGGTAAQPPVGGGTTAQPSVGGGATAQPPVGGGTTVQPPVGGGVTAQPPVGGGTTVQPPVGGGVTAQPPVGGGVTAQPPVAAGTSAQLPVAGGTTQQPPITAEPVTPPPPPPPPLPSGPQLTVTSRKAALKVGEPLQITVTPDQAANVYCLYQAGAGNVSRLWPNRFNGNRSSLRAGQALTVPQAGIDEFTINVQDRGSVERVACYAHDDPALVRKADASLGIAEDLVYNIIGTLPELMAEVDQAMGGGGAWEMVEVPVN